MPHADQWDDADNTLPLTVTGNENLTASSVVNLIARTADGSYITVSDSIGNIASESVSASLEDISVSGNTDFMLNFTDASGNNTTSNELTVNVPPILYLEGVAPGEWTSTGLNWS